MAAPIYLADLLDNVLDTRLEEVHVSLPGKVLKYDAAKQVADVQIMVKHKGFDYETEQPLYEEYPVLANVPVQWPRGGGFAVTLPLAEGDFVYLVFSESSLSEFRSTGSLSNPADASRHSISHAFAIPGAAPNSSPVPNASATNVIIGHGSSDGVIEISSGTVALGKNAVDFVALSQKVDAGFAAVRSAFNGHQHVETGGTTATPLPLMTAIPSTAATKVKAI